MQILSDFVSFCTPPDSISVANFRSPATSSEGKILKIARVSPFMHRTRCRENWSSGALGGGPPVISELHEPVM